MGKANTNKRPTRPGLLDAEAIAFNSIYATRSGYFVSIGEPESFQVHHGKHSYVRRDQHVVASLPGGDHYTVWLAANHAGTCLFRGRDDLDLAYRFPFTSLNPDNLTPTSANAYLSGVSDGRVKPHGVERSVEFYAEVRSLLGYMLSAMPASDQNIPHLKTLVETGALEDMQDATLAKTLLSIGALQRRLDNRRPVLSEAERKVRENNDRLRDERRARAQKKRAVGEQTASKTASKPEVKPIEPTRIPDAKFYAMREEAERALRESNPELKLPTASPREPYIPPRPSVVSHATASGPEFVQVQRVLMFGHWNYQRHDLSVNVRIDPDFTIHFNVIGKATPDALDAVIADLKEMRAAL